MYITMSDYGIVIHRHQVFDILVISANLKFFSPGS